MRWFANYFAETVNVGCAAAEYDATGVQDDLPNQHFHVQMFHCIADTGPEEKYFYKVGDSCTDCPNNRTCDIIYTSLCGV